MCNSGDSVRGTEVQLGLDGRDERSLDYDTNNGHMEQAQNVFRNRSETKNGQRW